MPVGDFNGNISGDTDPLMKMNVNMKKNTINVNNVKQQQQQPDIICHHPVTVPLFVVAGPYTTITAVIEIHLMTNMLKKRKCR